MEWTNEDREALQDFTRTIDNDPLKIKNKIKKILLNNRFLIHALDNKELEKVDAEPEDYYDVNILPYFLLADAQHDTENYVCFEVSYDKVRSGSGKAVKLNQIIFYVLCDIKNIKDDDTGVARHDLISALIIDDFNWTNYFGDKLYLVSDKPSSTDSHYATRTLIFEQTTDNNLVKTVGNTTRYRNKDIVV